MIIMACIIKLDFWAEDAETMTSVVLVRHPTGPFPVSPVPALAGEVIHRYRL
jgi:hypothetical protein